MAGWKRASIEMNTHPLHPFPKITQKDLLLPAAGDRLVLLGACLVCAAGLSILWLYVPLYITAIMLKTHLGIWLWGSMLAMTLGGGLLLFAVAAARARHYHDEV